MKQKSGFTLIELSIVLVIIGLIVGGILTGRDLVTAAYTRAQISQIEKYNVAVNTFKGKYGGLPGDLALPLATQFGFNVAGCDSTLGKRDGNGFIDGYWPVNYVLQGEDETSLFWADLSQANLIENGNGGAVWAGWCGGIASPLTLASGTYSIGNYFPAAKIGNGNFVYVYEGHHAFDGDTGFFDIGGDNWYGLSAITSVLTNGEMSSSPALSVTQAYNIDKKIDDGQPTTGSIEVIYLNNYDIYHANPQAGDSATSCYNTTTNAYSVSVNGGNGLNCALSFKFQ